ncbi:hypothetical protein PGB90_000389 [Kerria lacca]
MSTQAYYKDRLGFDPNESMNGELDKTQQGYEENLSKFKAYIALISILDIVNLFIELGQMIKSNVEL